MIRTGHYNTLSYNRVTDNGIYLTDGIDEVLLPKRYATEDMRPGDDINVFVYRDSLDRQTAVTDTPLATADSYAYLQVEELTDIGAFFNWGLQKDLLMPHSQMLGRVFPGEFYVVRVLIDDRSDRPIATVRLRPFFTKDLSSLFEGQQVECMVYEEREQGFMVIVNGEYSGLLPHSEFSDKPTNGDQFSAFITQIHEDTKITLSFAPAGGKARVEARNEIVDKLKAAGGFLPFNDKSSPDDIKREFGMSKKSFKKLAGSLFRLGFIEINKDGIKLIENP
jgi:predicted RNA-binding protein (virulence factor B family)